MHGENLYPTFSFFRSFSILSSLLICRSQLSRGAANNTSLFLKFKLLSNAVFNCTTYKIHTPDVLQIVPTTLFPLWSAPLESYQYSVTEYYSAIPQGARALPGVFFLYDFWPMRVEIRMVRLGFLHFFVRSCAVCGGVWALAKAVDGVVDWIVRKALDGLVSSRSL